MNTYHKCDIFVRLCANCGFVVCLAMLYRNQSKVKDNNIEIWTNIYSGLTLTCTNRTTWRKNQVFKTTPCANYVLHLIPICRCYEMFNAVERFPASIRLIMLCLCFYVSRIDWTHYFFCSHTWYRQRVYFAVVNNNRRFVGVSDQFVLANSIQVYLLVAS